MQAHYQTFRDTLKHSKHTIVVCGAGLSAASGIPTFRGAGGLWRTFNAISLATPQAFDRDPSVVWQFYHYRREVALAASPNRAHNILASLSLSSSPFRGPGSSFKVITQNVDGLSINAALAVSNPTEALDAIIQMHGSILSTTCMDCDHEEENRSSPICEALGSQELSLESSLPLGNIPLVDLPHCTREGCNGLLRPAVVWFGEEPRRMNEINELVDNADLCIVVGTSSTVYPAAGFAFAVKENGGKVAIFNLERTPGDDEADWLFLGPCEDTLFTAVGL
ncbi:DHS-like NAD/FAD-binding domain-containing protein [Cantharellus anzutake]|uniref:DHS-like NAD/FAD-binding domain-containing protein n=1 Tax=Cantharellus anzutake TaxID=1750568 RepID=UPI001908B787|nr:DHS-like NAD/FAD-binding domain-containing protein [Cantharellus anzutake]KAF8341488.1 DHS-like NAD/FAD-binding domain-containing protein [Cantharellus anzutake]